MYMHVCIHVYTYTYISIHACGAVKWHGPVSSTQIGDVTCVEQMLTRHQISHPTLVSATIDGHMSSFTPLHWASAKNQVEFLSYLFFAKCFLMTTSAASNVCTGLVQKTVTSFFPLQFIVCFSMYLSNSQQLHTLALGWHQKPGVISVKSAV